MDTVTVYSCFEFPSEGVFADILYFIEMLFAIDFEGVEIFIAAVALESITFDTRFDNGTSAMGAESTGFHLFFRFEV
ncbi:hypothetical protein JCM30204_07730 [Dysgonomonas termitidis]